MKQIHSSNQIDATDRPVGDSEIEEARASADLDGALHLPIAVAVEGHSDEVLVHSRLQLVDARDVVVVIHLGPAERLVTAHHTQ